VGVIVLQGCGADSDLLKDQNINKKPSGKAYDILKEDIYEYREVNTNKLGFNYLSLDDECNTKKCSLQEATYFFKDKESKNIPLDKKIVLTQNGWFEKSKHSECKMNFSGKSFIEICPDGRKFDTKIVKINLEGQELNQIENASLYYDKLKDQQATFTYDSEKYDFHQKSDFDIYEILDSDSSKCKVNKTFARNDTSLTEHMELQCYINGISFKIKDVPASEGIVVVNGTTQQAWKKEKVNNKYTIINLGKVDDREYFVASYNSFVRIGTILPKLSTESFINTEAFNVIYTQLKDKYK